MEPEVLELIFAANYQLASYVVIVAFGVHNVRTLPYRVQNGISCSLRFHDSGHFGISLATRSR